MPIESKKDETMLEEEEDSDNSNNFCSDDHSKEKSAIEVNDDGKVSAYVDKIRMHDKNKKKNDQYPFEMIDNIANTMKKLENIVTDCYSESDK